MHRIWGTNASKHNYKREERERYESFMDLKQKDIRYMLRLFRCAFLTFRSGRLLLRGAGALGLVLLLAGGCLVIAPHAAHASGPCSNPPPVYQVHTTTSANTHSNYTDLGDPEW